jgi:ABC-2 type transport system ATP-binding protein
MCACHPIRRLSFHVCDPVDTMNVALACDNLTKDYPVGLFRRRRVRALDGLTLEVPTGGIFGFLGPNGAGKTTLMKIAVGLLFPTSGSITVLGRSVDDLRVRSRLGFVPENPTFPDRLTPRELLDSLARLFGFSRWERRARITHVLTLVGLDAERVEQPLRKLSRGMLTRVALAQALLNDPDLLILDEPLTGLDPLGRFQIRDLLLTLKARGKTIFLSTHILSDVETLCDRIAIINRGRLVASGTLAELLNHAESRALEIIAVNIDADACRELVARGASVQPIPGGVHIEVSSDADLDPALQIIRQRGGRLISITPAQATLERFLRDTKSLP